MNRKGFLVLSIFVLVVLIALSVTLGLCYENNEIGTVADWIEALSTFMALIVTGFTAYLAYEKYLKEETFTSSEDQVVVFSTKQQTTELHATPQGLELHLYDIRPGRRKGKLWSIPASDLAPIPEISVYPSKKKSEWGLFDIGYRRHWYYSTKLFSDEKDLQDTIVELIEKSKQLASI
jgi:hypothetical protein